AYLLYTHRFPLERQGVLVVGPNPLFLRYIEHVLPSLGESGVTLSTVSGLVGQIRVRAREPVALSRLKGDARMAKVLAAAVHGRERRLPSRLDLAFGASVVHLEVAESQAIVERARRRPGSHNQRRRFVEDQVLGLLADRYERFAQGRRGASLATPADAGEGDSGRAELVAKLRRVPELREALDRMWPRLEPHELVHDLFGAPPLIAWAGEGILSKAEQTMLVRPRCSSFDEVPWTDADAALVDEARAILGPRREPKGRPRAERSDDLADPFLEPEATVIAPDEVRSFGHIVVDEAQDLSPMQLRMISRRSLSGSMTVVGDIAQATGAWTPNAWSEVARHLGSKTGRLVELTVSYRTPAEVLALSARVLHLAAPGIEPPVAVRRSGHPPEVVEVLPGALGAKVADIVRDELAAAGEGKVALLAPETLVAELAGCLRGAGLHPVDPRDPEGQGLEAPLIILPATEAHGLEFDSAIVVEPAALCEWGGEGGLSLSGLRTLYVALTRPTRRLTIVSSLPLPVDLLAPTEPTAPREPWSTA
ncbi:MAG: HelD family protein, partial [Acidimicrobiales bacterium]